MPDPSSAHRAARQAPEMTVYPAAPYATDTGPMPPMLTPDSGAGDCNWTEEVNASGAADAAPATPTSAATHTPMWADNERMHRFMNAPLQRRTPGPPAKAKHRAAVRSASISHGHAIHAHPAPASV